MLLDKWKSVCMVKCTFSVPKVSLLRLRAKNFWDNHYILAPTLWQGYNDSSMGLFLLVNINKKLKI